MNAKGWIGATLIAVWYALIIALLATTGCAWGIQTAYYKSGEVCARTRSLVWGTGETEQVSNTCGDYAYSTKDTGLSDNGKDALGTIAEGVARGAVGALVPIP